MKELVGAARGTERAVEGDIGGEERAQRLGVPFRPAGEVFDEPIAAGVPSGHPLARKAAVSVRALADEDVITLPAGTGIRTALDQTCRAAGIVLTPAVEVHSPEAALALAAQGAGVAVLASSMVAGTLKKLVIRRAARTALSLASRAEAGAAARAFLDLLRARLDQGPVPATP